MKRALVPALALPLLCGCVFGSSKSPALQNPPAPFAAQELVKTAPELKELTAQNTYAKGRGAVGQRYSFVCGDKSFYSAPGDQAANFRIAANGLDILSFGYWGSTKAGFGHPFNDSEPELKLDLAEKSVTCVRKFEALAKDDSLFVAKAQELPDGSIEMTYDAKPAPGGKLTDRGLFISSTRYEHFAGSKLQIGDKLVALSPDAAPYGDKTLFEGDFSGKLTFFADRPDKSFSIELPEKSFIYIKEMRKEADKGIPWKYSLSMRIQPPRNSETLKLKLDLGKASAEAVKTADEYAGINFWKLDRLHIPDFGGSKNMLPNPSFEEGLAYWRDFGWASSISEDREIYTIDDTVAFSGKRSLKINAFKDYPDPSVLATFAIPTVPGKDYTFSYYSKADGPDLFLNMRIISAEWPNFPKWPAAERITTEWKRHSYTVKAPSHVLSFMISVSHRSKDIPLEHAWIDAMQLEESPVATDYAEPPVAIALLTSKEGNYLKTGEPMDARVRVHAAPNAKGKLNCEVVDFFYSKPFVKSFDFETGADGDALIPLALDGKIGTGAFVLRSDVKMADGSAKTEFNRITIMEPAPAACPQKSVFGGILNLSTRSNFQAQRMSELGIGSTCYTSKELTDKISASHGMPNSGSGTAGYGPGSYSACAISDRPEICKRIESEPYSDSLRDDVERLAFGMAKTYPWIRTWFIQAESSCDKIGCLKTKDYEGFAKLMLATRAGTVKADPTLKNMPEGGPCNMSPTSGIADYDHWLTALDKLAPDVRFDSFAIHPYRPTPEDPDLDADAATYLKMLESHNYKTEPVYWNEGSYYCPWVVPAWDINLGFCDRYRCGYTSYDMGWAERVSAAWNARSWLVALKYSDRVRQLVSWAYHGFAFMDANSTISALGKTSNTLCNLLGDAKFKKDIRFAVNCRAYVFEDGAGRPVAAVWSHIPEVDRGLEQSPVAKMRFAGVSPEFIDLMENQLEPAVDANGMTEIPVTPFPLFIRGEAGQTDALCKAIATCSLMGSKEFPVAVDMKLKSRTLAKLSFENRLSKAFEGEADAGAVKMPLSIAENSSKSFDLSLPAPLPFDRIERVSMPLKVAEKGGDSIEKDFSLYAYAVAKAESWDEVPWIKLNNRKVYKILGVPQKAGYEKDFDVEFKMRWTADKLCLLVKVVDDKPFFPKGENRGGDWNFDSVQIYIDTYGDNANRKSKAIFDFNDYSYCLSRDAETGKARVWRENAPEAQIGDAQANAFPHSEVKDVPASVTMTPDGYVYEIQFPRMAVSPLQLKNGSFGRFALFVNDNDGEGRKGGMVSTVDPDSEPYANPEQWPGIILVEEKTK